MSDFLSASGVILTKHRQIEILRRYTHLAQHNVLDKVYDIIEDIEGIDKTYDFELRVFVRAFISNLWEYVSND